jgi:hypothetical protein
MFIINDKTDTIFFFSFIVDTNNNGQATTKSNVPSKLQTKTEKEEQVIAYSFT